MSDYLWNVAARALNQATVVRPRLAPLYGATDLSPELADIESRRAESPIGEGPLVLARPTQTNRSTVVKPQPVDVESIQQKTPHPKQTEPIAPVRLLESEPAMRRRPDFEIPLMMPFLGVQEQRVQEQHDQEQRVQEQRVQAPTQQDFAAPSTPAHALQKQSSPPLVDSNPQPRSNNARTEKDLRWIATPESADPGVATPMSEINRDARVPSQLKPNVTSTQQKEPPNPQEARPRAIPVEVTRALHQSPVSKNTTPEPVPTIQVTIGRIEVRAIPAAQPMRLAASKSTSSNLEEYLKRRAQGGES